MININIVKKIIPGYSKTYIFYKDVEIDVFLYTNFNLCWLSESKIDKIFIGKKINKFDKT